MTCHTCHTCNVGLKKVRQTYTLPTKDSIERHTSEVYACPSCGKIHIPAEQTIDLTNLKRQLKGDE
ncbi:hypothetical protein HXA34_20310 [Salipaludibacillus agaradhaerens]|nr:hypothetical protein [Salipaludibacillus agaradhaerens]MCR6120665.1 hypothetical protein [Salipaludibacillus agaradhaerens]